MAGSRGRWRLAPVPAFAIGLLVLAALGSCDEDRHCFAAGTRIATPTGQRAIESISVGEAVLGYDHRQNKVVSRLVTATHRHVGSSFRLLKLGDKRLGVTDEHPIYDGMARRYRPAAEIRRGSRLLGATYEARQRSAVPIEVTAVSRTPLLRGTVYNISVAGTQNYFAEGILVHNKQPNPCWDYSADTYADGQKLKQLDPCVTCTCVGAGAPHCVDNGSCND